MRIGEALDGGAFNITQAPGIPGCGEFPLILSNFLQGRESGWSATCRHCATMVGACSSHPLRLFLDMLPMNRFFAIRPLWSISVFPYCIPEGFVFVQSFFLAALRLRKKILHALAGTYSHDKQTTTLLRQSVVTGVQNTPGHAVSGQSETGQLIAQ